MESNCNAERLFEALVQDDASLMKLKSSVTRALIASKSMLKSRNEPSRFKLDHNNDLLETTT
jgi:hypothetical protein